MGKAADSSISLQGTQLTNAINTTSSWTGQGMSGHFKSDWNGQHRQSLMKAVSLLRSGARELKDQANQQEFASNRSGESFRRRRQGCLRHRQRREGPGGPAVAGLQAAGARLAGIRQDQGAPDELACRGTVLREALDALRNGGKITDVITDLKAGIPFSPAFLEASKFSQGLRLAGALAAPLNIVGGISDVVDPQHDGWRGTGDRIAGGLSVASGVGSVMLMTAGGAALLGPIGAPIIVGAGIVAGAWALGNLVADNWDSISNFARNPGSYLADGAGEVADFAQDTATKVTDGVSNAAKSVGNFVGGIFG